MATNNFLEQIGGIGGGLLGGLNTGIQSALGNVGGGGLGGALTEFQAAKLAQQQQALQQANLAAQTIAPALIPLLDEVGTPFAGALSRALQENPAGVLAVMGGPSGFNEILKFIEGEADEATESRRWEAYESVVSSPNFASLDRGEKFKRINSALGPGKSDEAERIVKNLEGQTEGALDANDVLIHRERLAARYKPFRESIDAYFSLRDTIGNPDTTTPAADIGAIFQFMKVLDPTSTVREGEQATVQNARGVPERIRILWNKLMTGETLGREQRLDLIKTARDVTAPRVRRQLQQEAGDRAAIKGVSSTKSANEAMTGLTITEDEMLEFGLFEVIE